MFNWVLNTPLEVLANDQYQFNSSSCAIFQTRKTRKMIVKNCFLFEFTISLQTNVFLLKKYFFSQISFSLANSNMWDLLVRVWQICPSLHKHTHTHTHTHTNGQYMSKLGVEKKIITIWFLKENKISQNLFTTKCLNCTNFSQLDASYDTTKWWILKKQHHHV